MKRWLVSLICIFMTFSLASCGGKENGLANDTASPSGRIAINYQSRRGKNNIWH